MTSGLSIWAGVECTVNRVGDRYLDQCARSGHAKRLQDLKLFKQLGIERIRYPFLWETIEAQRGQRDWSWADERTAELRALDLKPIAGLLHHGSGPSFTNLLDPEFPTLFADYAERFAERYPWISDYTPINEPLTTARFSALYGHWYPHQNEAPAFLKALQNQCIASLKAMQAIRRINPQARWIQTEDIGRAQGTFETKEQVAFENSRRWLSFDFLCGRIQDSHPLWNYLCDIGLEGKEWDWLQAHFRAPDILGLNHYLLSNRFLDHRLEHYPPGFHGGNGRQAYADVGAIDTRAVMPPLPESIFLEVWNRYQIPLAVTEVHLHGFREDQLRWLCQIHKAATSVRQMGVDMRAITAWSLLGSFDWNSLCTKADGFYESGIFDIRAPQPRPTVLSKPLRAWTQGEEFEHPLLSQEGWWKTKVRAAFGPENPALLGPLTSAKQKPILITGAQGTLGRAFARICAYRNIPFHALCRKKMDIAQIDRVQKTLREIQPWAVINTAGYVRVDDAETEKEKCFLENVVGPENLAKVCANLEIPFVHFSSDLVFDGEHDQPYLESHPVSPLNTYGRSKMTSEQKVLSAWPSSLIIRASSFFGPWDEHNFIFKSLRQLAQGQSVFAASDVTMSPTYVPDLVHLCLDLLIDGESGVFHLTNDGHISWSELASLAAQMAKISGSVVGRPLEEMNYVAPRPRFSALKSERVRILPHFEDALGRYFRELEIPLDLTLTAKMENRI